MKPHSLTGACRAEIEFQLKKIPMSTPEQPATTSQTGPAAIGPDAPVTLREITSATVRTICKLSNTLTPAQQRMVAANAVSIAEAYFEPNHWFRAIYAGETPVGFVMLYTGPDDFIRNDGEKICYLWRFMIAGPYQRMGFGRRALTMVINDLRAQGVKEFYTSVGTGEASPELFYAGLGFKLTGQVLDDGELAMRLEL